MDERNEKRINAGMVKSTLYKMGEFIEIEHPFEDETQGVDEDYYRYLQRLGYIKGFTLGSEDFPYIEIFEANVFKEDIELCYTFYACICIECLNGRDLFFQNWYDVLHFLQNYSGWVKNYTESEKNMLISSKLREEEEERTNRRNGYKLY